MDVKIEKAKEIGFCFGVRRAIEMLEKAAREYGRVETLGSVVHNDQVMQRLNNVGVNVIHNIDEISGDVVAISSHGISPKVEAEIKSRKVNLIDTTCPFVKRAQMTARRLAEDGLRVVVFGEAQHTEVKGILGWAQGKGIATLDVSPFFRAENQNRRIGILSQTTQIPENFNQFVKNMVDLTLRKDAEIRVIDTICHDIRTRQTISLELARNVDLMLVVGGHSSANTKRLQELCAKITETYHVDTVEAINLSWLKGKKHIGITSGTSTAEQEIEEIIKYIMNA